MDLSSPEMNDITAAVELFRRGEKLEARARLLELWAACSAQDARLPMSVTAHFLADTEADVADELEWDLRALEIATGSRAAEDLKPVSAEFESFLPSLHGSVGNGYWRLGDLDLARRHVAIAVDRVGVLADDAYGQLVRGILRRLQVGLGMPLNYLSE